MGCSLFWHAGHALCLRHSAAGGPRPLPVHPWRTHPAAAAPVVHGPQTPCHSPHCAAPGRECSRAGTVSAGPVTDSVPCEQGHQQGKLFGVLSCSAAECQPCTCPAPKAPIRWRPPARAGKYHHSNAAWTAAAHSCSTRVSPTTAHLPQRDLRHPRGKLERAHALADHVSLGGDVHEHHHLGYRG